MVYKFGGSSLATAARMLEVADIVCSFPDEAPVVVLSAMGKVRPSLPKLKENLYACSELQISMRWFSLFQEILRYTTQSRELWLGA